MNTTCTKPTALENDEPFAHESTYAMLVRSEEKERTILETLLYFLVVVSAIAALLQFAHQSIALPLEEVTTVADAPAHCVTNTNC